MMLELLMMLALLAAMASASVSPPLPLPPPPPLLDTLTFGDAASERAHQLAASGVDAAKSKTTGGQPCRSPCTAPSSCRSGWPSDAATASLRFTMAVDPAAQTYLTVKFDGSETSSSTMVTVLNESFGGSVSDCGYPPELNMCFGTGDGVSENHCADPIFNGRWQYSTMLLPRSLTAGNTSANITLTTTHTMQTVYRAYTHTTALPTLAADEIQPPAPPPAGPMPGPTAVVPQFDYLLAQVDAGVDQMMSMQLWGAGWDAAVAAAPEKAVLTGGIWPHQTNVSTVRSVPKDKIKGECLGGSIGSNNNWFRGLEIMGRAYLLNASKHFRSSDVLARIVAGVDFYQLAQGHNGGFDPRPRLPSGWIGAPARRNGSGCLEGVSANAAAAAAPVAVAVPNERIGGPSVRTHRLFCRSGSHRGRAGRRCLIPEGGRGRHGRQNNDQARCLDTAACQLAGLPAVESWTRAEPGPGRRAGCAGGGQRAWQDWRVGKPAA